MSHLDEGTLHALLDGELEPTQMKEIQAHLGGCSACGTRLREVKDFKGEADRLIASLDLPEDHELAVPVLPASDPAPAPIATPPAAVLPPPPAPAAPAAPLTEAARPVLTPPDAPAAPRPQVVRPPSPPPAASAPPPPPRPAPRPPRPLPEPRHQEVPVLLIPDNPDAAQARPGLLRRLRWAAMIAMVVGAGYLAVGIRNQKSETTPPLYSVPDQFSDVVLSPEEAGRPLAGSTSDTMAKPPAASAGAAALKAKPAPPQQPAAPAVESKDLAKSRPAPVGKTGRTAESEAPRPNVDVVSERQDFEELRAEADQATAELDRQRRIARAAEATAALARDRRRAQDAAAVQPAAQPAPAPQPATLEQRAQTYLRIGLDEAVRHLGGPMHVIEAMSPAFVGLAQGRLSPGADSTRPVVRVVYQDPQGRMVLLDQQRLRPGQSTAYGGADPHWTIRDVLLHLHGEPGPDVLRSLRGRVR